MRKPLNPVGATNLLFHNFFGPRSPVVADYDIPGIAGLFISGARQVLLYSGSSGGPARIGARQWLPGRRRYPVELLAIRIGLATNLGAAHAARIVVLIPVRQDEQ
jgi:hypothetical protein